MAFCRECGTRIADNARFCYKCGLPTGIEDNPHQSTRKTVYEGNIHVCPRCGEPIKSFSAFCPACGHEFRDTGASNAVQSIVAKLEKCVSTNQKIECIRSFPIPNTKEDLFEFMLLASSNISTDIPQSLLDAWITKLDQCHKKAQLTLSDKDFKVIDEIYQEATQKISRITTAYNAKQAELAISKIFSAILRNAGFIIGLIVNIHALNIDRSGGNASMAVLAGLGILYFSGFSLFRENVRYSDILFGLISGCICLSLSNSFYNGSMHTLAGYGLFGMCSISFFVKIMNNN
ncbi:MAG: zinc ribbon domain-containing protein [Clostridiales bacterium]|nr:zinc ribbon domain-containing protein [Clostridiales bacterium]